MSSTVSANCWEYYPDLILGARSLMDKIALVGPFNSQMQASLQKILPGGFELFIVPSTDEYDKLQDADYIIFRTLELREPTIRSLRKTKFIQRWGAGYDIIDIEAAGKRNIPVAVMTGINATQVAEMTILLTLAVFRNIVQMHNGILDGQWPRNEFMKRAYVINGKRVGIVGLGNIGAKVAALFRVFGADVQYFDIRRRTVETETQYGVRYVSFEELLKTSDIVSLHVPLDDTTQHMMNGKTLALMKPTAVLVNTSRGGVVDEPALCDALGKNRLLGAGLDVFASEPVGKDSPLRSLNNVVMSPHVGGNTVDNNDNMAGRAIGNIVKFSMGQPISPADLVNAQYLPKG
jgi:D-3-phosphoglycerate dehydrogenase / 2-oxoglutarate reductase